MSQPSKRRFRLYWPWPPLPLDAKLWITAIVALLAATTWVSVHWPGRLSTNFGFGPDWACTSVPSAEPVCAKKPDTTKPAQAN